MFNKYIAFVFSILFSMTSFSQTDSPSQVYKSKEIGWTIAIPNGFNIIADEQYQIRREKGVELLENTAYEGVDISKVKTLIGFQKNQLNSFQSTSEPYPNDDMEAWKESNAFLKDELFKGFKKQGIKIEASETTIIKIDGLDFHVFEFTLYSPKGDVLINQLVYGRLINGLDFGVNIIYNNEADKKHMLDTWLNSKFSK